MFCICVVQWTTFSVARTCCQLRGGRIYLLNDISMQIALFVSKLTSCTCAAVSPLLSLYAENRFIQQLKFDRLAIVINIEYTLFCYKVATMVVSLE